MRAVLYTVGHGTRSTEELAAVVGAHGVARIVDVRRHPGSRRHPHLSRDALTDGLARLRVAYEWWGEPLGGRRRAVPESRHAAWRNAAFRAYADHMDTNAFRDALERLLVETGREPLAVMCAETVWWNCHRRLIADAAVLRDADVVHLMSDRDAKAHPLHPSVRAGDDGWPVYDVGLLGA